MTIIIILITKFKKLNYFLLNHLKLLMYYIKFKMIYLLIINFIYLKYENNLIFINYYCPIFFTNVLPNLIYIIYYDYFEDYFDIY